ncbi:uncharacterized protein K02A2.6-like [Macrosteles quadrilineatus]|uniref:uncharacterized protein K02A2.6-like n=1 Tax=Macrosteles quadrilineatus TaxID=74068 RepID=UPI0023E31962|nr:uncharacterized protein K02A2.6-like [Macrosteles quadrilineatus]
MVEDKPLDMVIDTGAIMTVLPKHIYDDKFSHINLRPTELQLKSYTGHPLDVLGEFKAAVSHEGKDYHLPVVVVGITDCRQPALLGRNWLHQLKLDWNRILQVGSGNNAGHNMQDAVNKTEALLVRLKEFGIKANYQKTLLGEKKGIPVLAAARMQRWAIILSAYDYHIIYRKGSEIVEADALSRLPKKLDPNSEDISVIQFFAPFPELPLTAKEISLATRRDPLFSKVLDLTLQGWPTHLDKDEPLRAFFLRKNELSVENGCILWGNRVLIPTRFQKHLLDMLHEEHPGVCKIKALARSFVWWPKIDDQIENVVKTCEICKMTRKSAPKLPLQPWQWPSKKWQRVHLDFAQKDGVYFLILVDSFSKWVEVYQMNGTNASKTIERLRTCFAAYGVPENIITDGGPPFRSEEFESFLRFNGINHIFSPPYHPASNGQAESMVGTFKTSLLKQVLQDNLKGRNRTLQHKLDCFMFAYRNTPHSITGRTPSELFLGFQPRTRFTLLKPDFKSNMESKQQKIKESSDQHRGKWRSFTLGQEVWVKSIRNEETRWMPGVIIKCISPVTYIVSVRGQKRFVHADHLKELEGELPIMRREEPEITPPRPLPVLSPSKSLVEPPIHVDQSQSPTRSPPPRKSLPPQKSPSPRKSPLPKGSITHEQEPLRRSKRMITAPQKLNL